MRSLLGQRHLIIEHLHALISISGIHELLTYSWTLLSGSLLLISANVIASDISLISILLLVVFLAVLARMTPSQYFAQDRTTNFLHFVCLKISALPTSNSKFSTRNSTRNLIASKTGRPMIRARWSLTHKRVCMDTSTRKTKAYAVTGRANVILASLSTRFFTSLGTSFRCL